MTQVLHEPIVEQRRLRTRLRVAREKIGKTQQEVNNVFGALKAGASGFLLKDTPPADLLAGIRLVAAGDALLSPSVTRHLIAEYVRRPDAGRPVTASLQALTEREVEVLSLVAKGLSKAEIAQRLYVSPATAKTHVARLLMKLDARDRAQLIIVADETRLVSQQQPGPR